MDDLAQAAGFPGYQGMDFRTGDFRYDDDAYLTCIELWKELQDDGLFYPGSGRLTVASARTRWAAGVAAYFPDGPWCAGGVKNVAPGVEEQLGVGPLLVPDAGMTAVAYRGGPASQFFVAATTADPEAATALVASMTSTEYLQGLARGMDQPPLDLTAVDTPGVVEPYRQLAGWFLETVKTAPEPVVRNAAVAAVEAASRPLTPDLGTIVQGYLGGDVPDLRRALRQLSDAAERDREQALAAATAQGADVSRDDFAFPDWQPGQDYTYG
jgi:ABC-type glycerol-3-phosphate transport system substrate-binding protein